MKNKSLPAEGTLLRVHNQLTKIFRHKWSALLLLVVFAGSCKKINEETGLTSLCPTVISTNPLDKATGVNLNTKLDATFSKAMNASAINTTTFLLKQGATLVPGLVTYTGVVATFTPAATLTANTIYTGVITTGARDPENNALVSDYVWNFTTGNPDVVAPRVISTDPINAAVNVTLDKKITATFSEIMDSLSATSSFTVTNTTLGGTAIPGTVTYAGTTAVFTPAGNLTANTTYTGTITTGAKDVSGNALATNYTWNFTTNGDITLPTVIATDPLNGATGVVLNKKITATFSELMNPVTINPATFVLNQGATTVAGTVTYVGTVATFSPLVNLAPNTIYTATITTGAKDLSGNAVAANYVWSFTTLASVLPPSILGTIINFGAFGGNAGITNEGLNTVINNGGIGTTAAATLITGFHDGLTADVYTETPLNVGNAKGGIFTAPPFPGNATSFAKAQQALLDATAAYLSISPASKPGGIDPGAGELGGLTLAPGVYKSASGTFNISNGNLTLDAMGDPNAQWFFQTAAGLTVGIAGPTGAKSVILTNGAQAKNVYWHVGSAATINGAGGGRMVGTIIASSGVTFSTAGNAAQTVLDGRAISLVASVTLVNTTINVPQ